MRPLASGGQSSTSKAQGRLEAGGGSKRMPGVNRWGLPGDFIEIDF
jgi:hypothetical protein